MPVARQVYFEQNLKNDAVAKTACEGTISHIFLENVTSFVFLLLLHLIGIM